MLIFVKSLQKYYIFLECPKVFCNFAVIFCKTIKTLELFKLKKHVIGKQSYFSGQCR